MSIFCKQIFLYLFSYLYQQTLNIKKENFKLSDSKCDQHIQVLLLCEVGWTYDQIAFHLYITWCQVQYACNTGHPTSAKCPGWPGTLFFDQIQTLIKFICTFFENCQLLYQELADYFAWRVSREAVKNTLNKAGFSHYVMCHKSPISEKNHVNCLA